MSQEALPRPGEARRADQTLPDLAYPPSSSLALAPAGAATQASLPDSVPSPSPIPLPPPEETGFRHNELNQWAWDMKYYNQLK